jgi:hypothetical protein
MGPITVRASGFIVNASALVPPLCFLHGLRFAALVFASSVLGGGQLLTTFAATGSIYSSKILFFGADFENSYPLRPAN